MSPIQLHLTPRAGSSRTPLLARGRLPGRAFEITHELVELLC